MYYDGTNQLRAKHVPQDNFFYKIKEDDTKAEKSYQIIIPKTGKKYRIVFDAESPYGFSGKNGIPPEWERFIKQMGVSTKEIAKDPFEFLMAINFTAT
jgi:hypothetical protein